MGKVVDSIPSILNKCLFVSPDGQMDTRMDGQTDRQTDGQTDRTTVIQTRDNPVSYFYGLIKCESYLDHVTSPCLAYKRAGSTF